MPSFPFKLANASSKEIGCVSRTFKYGTNSSIMSEDLAKMNTLCDWLFKTILISVYDSFFRNYISIALLSFIVFSNQSQRLFI